MKEVSDFSVQKIEHYQDNDFMLYVNPINKKLNQGKPGQFVNILVEGSPTTMLRRPISICDVNAETNTLLLYIKQVGDGTRQLAQLKKGDNINIVYPLGNGFTTDNVKNPLLVGGGTGIAPMIYLSKELNKKGIKPHVLLGARTSQALSLKNMFSSIAHLHITTDDGSEGTKGVVINHLIFKEITTFDYIYTCGPNAMMQAVASIAQKNNIPCEVSLENTMACGIGVCLCCVTSTTTGNRCVCTEGPVFLSTELTNFLIN
ncbi:MAG: dihydroorotate dehydrogenase electron transfer subunit [Bacteroidales bacterium]|jgi:dihydroorotate dehydrogenase electron transfer subunit|nr:dihydroorotate dehydrogenase electron transfer subunit [Bacteroidales bacterium]